MPTPKPLSPQEAAHTLAHRFVRRADRLRQLATRFGIRPYRVWLVWSKSSGAEFGTGRTAELQRREILPTPRVRTNLNRVLLSGGIVPMGSVELTEVSGALTYEQLIGRDVPAKGEESAPGPYEFHYEVVEDGRDGSAPRPQRFRPFGDPTREPGNVQWRLTLAPVSEENL
jgi:hypothetical protein